MKYFKWFYIILVLTLLLSCNKKIEQVETQDLHFFILSDWGWNASENQIEVAKQLGNQAIKMKPEFILTCGDNFQFDGVMSVDDSLWKINYEQVYNYSPLKIPWYPALGNHDYLGNVNAEIEYSDNNKYWCMPARYYSFIKSTADGTTIRFIIIDTQDLIINYNNLSDTTNVNSIEQIHWLNLTLAESKQDWICVIGHHPVFSAGYHGNTNELISLLKRIRPTNHMSAQKCLVYKLREEFFELRSFGVIDVVDDIGKPFLGIDVVFLARTEETVKHGDVPGCLMTAGKQIVLSTQSQGADRVFN